jgi:hypothetical protein
LREEIVTLRAKAGAVVAIECSTTRRTSAASKVKIFIGSQLISAPPDQLGIAAATNQADRDSRLSYFADREAPSGLQLSYFEEFRFKGAAFADPTLWNALLSLQMRPAWQG